MHQKHLKYIKKNNFFIKKNNFKFIKNTRWYVLLKTIAVVNSLHSTIEEQKERWYLLIFTIFFPLKYEFRFTPF